MVEVTDDGARSRRAPYGNSYGQSSVTKTQVVTKVTETVAEKVVIYYAWWDSQFICNINCARFHFPANNQKTAKCTLKNGYWTPRPTECIYKSPCSNPTTPNGIFQCWEQTILPEDVEKGGILLLSRIFWSENFSPIFWDLVFT
jgi:hypothetical protein